MLGLGLLSGWVLHARCLRVPLAVRTDHHYSSVRQKAALLYPYFEYTAINTNGAVKILVPIVVFVRTGLSTGSGDKMCDHDVGYKRGYVPCVGIVIRK